MNCPRCKSSANVKNGIIKGVQRYKCKTCSNNYTVTQKSTSKLPSEKRLGLIMYLEGLSFHSIGKLLGVSHVTALKWIEKYGNRLENIKNENPVSIMEIDELRAYIRVKKATVEFGLQLIERGNDTLISLQETEHKRD